MELSEVSPAAARAAAAVSDPAAMAPTFRAAQLIMISDVRRNFNEGHDPDGNAWPKLAHPRPDGGDKPLMNRGLLAASVSARAGDREVILGTNRPGAQLQQNGGVIKPVAGKFLAIPLTKEAVRSGGPRKFPQTLHAVVNSATGKGVLADRAGTAHFALCKQVTIPPRPFMGFGKRLVDKLAKLFGDFLERLLAGR